MSAEEDLIIKLQQIALIQEGERALDAGRSRSHAAVVTLLQKRGILGQDYVPFAREKHDDSYHGL